MTCFTSHPDKTKKKSYCIPSQPFGLSGSLFNIQQPQISEHLSHTLKYVYTTVQKFGASKFFPFLKKNPTCIDCIN